MRVLRSAHSTCTACEKLHEQTAKMRKIFCVQGVGAFCDWLRAEVQLCLDQQAFRLLDGTRLGVSLLAALLWTGFRQ